MASDLLALIRGVDVLPGVVQEVEALVDVAVAVVVDQVAGLQTAV